MQLKITLVRSPIGYERSQAATARALGLGRLHSSAIQEDTPAIRGMVRKIRHLVVVEPTDLPARKTSRRLSKADAAPRRAPAGTTAKAAQPVSETTAARAKAAPAGTGTKAASAKMKTAAKPAASKASAKAAKAGAKAPAGSASAKAGATKAQKTTKTSGTTGRSAAKTSGRKGTEAK